jgi:hypothetical protein
MMRRALLLLCLSASVIAHGQGPTATAVLDTTVIRLGEQVKLDLEVIYRVDQGSPGVVIWPSLEDTLTKQVEVVWDGGVDTALVDAAKDPYLFAQRRHLVVTAWDSGFWAIPPFRFVVAADTIETAPLLLEVRTLPVDTAQAYRDIKDIYDVPFSWRHWLRENWPYVAGGVAMLGATALHRLAGAQVPEPSPWPPHRRPLPSRCTSGSSKRCAPWSSSDSGNRAK